MVRELGRINYFSILSRKRPEECLAVREVNICSFLGDKIVCLRNLGCKIGGHDDADSQRAKRQERTQNLAKRGEPAAKATFPSAGVINQAEFPRSFFGGARSRGRT